MIQGPHWRQVDVSLKKRFSLSQRKSVEVRAEVVNVLNTRNFNNPNARTDQAEYGTITSARIPRQSQFSVAFRF